MTSDQRPATGDQSATAPGASRSRRGGGSPIRNPHSEIRNGSASARRAGVPLACALLLAAALAVPGCTHNQTSLYPDGRVRQTTDTGSAATMTREGVLTASYKGAAPSHSMVDKTGIWATTSGPVGLVGLVTEGVQMFLQSPKDVEMTGVEFAFDPPRFQAETLSMNLSEPLARQAQMYAQAVAALKDMTQAEAEARVRQMEVAGEITRAVADLLRQILLPTLPTEAP